MLTEPIVEGACPFCGKNDGLRFMCNGAATMWHVNCWKCGATGPVRCADLNVPNRTEASKALAAESWEKRAGYLVPTDPADVVAELRRDGAHQMRDVRAYANHLADLVAEKLGVKP